MKKVITIIIVMMLLAGIPAVAIPASAKPSTFTVLYHRAVFQWRARVSPIGAWDFMSQNNPISSVFTLTGNVLHTVLPTETTWIDIQGDSTVYVYDAKERVWIEKEGTFEYTSPNPTHQRCAVYDRGYLKFSDAPDPSSTFVHGVVYRWVYVYGVDWDTVKVDYSHAVWDSKMDAWLIAFILMWYDPTTYTQSYTIPFPSPFIEPVPASDYNPMGL